MTTDRLEANLGLYGQHQVAARLLFWFPTSILFFLSQVELGVALRLGAVYFLSVVVVEVPSGWMSDRFGRVITLRLGATWWIVAYTLFLVAGSSVLVLSAAQVFVALGFAFLSGTDSSFHFDSLEALGRPEEFEAREARVARNAFLGTTAAAVAGGSLGLIDLRLPFAASLVAACYQLVVALRMTEPAAAAGSAGDEAPSLEPTSSQQPLSSQEPTSSRQQRQLVAVAGYLRRSGLAWIFLFMTVQQPLESLAFDLIQPWLAELVGTDLSDAGLAPLYSGLLVATISLVGAVAAANSHVLRRRVGLRAALITLAAIEAAILLGMALVISAWLVPLLALRSTQAAAAPVLVASATAPQIARNHRATFLSMGSLAGRLAYGLILLVLGGIDDLQTVLTSAAVIGIASVLALVAASAALDAEEE